MRTLSLKTCCLIYVCGWSKNATPHKNWKVLSFGLEEISKKPQKSISIVFFSSKMNLTWCRFVTQTDADGYCFGVVDSRTFE